MNQAPPITQNDQIMGSTNQKDPKTENQAGFTLCPTFSFLPIQSIPSKSQPKLIAEPKKIQKVNEKQLRIKLISLFRKDKKKYHDICDKFIDIMELPELCQNIKTMTEFITKTCENQTFSFTSQLNSNDAKNSHFRKSGLHLYSFSNNIEFITSVFSREKFMSLLQTHSTYQKIVNFLQFLFLSLQAFSFTNERQWILMKDQIERHLVKYEKNVNKILEINESEFKFQRKQVSKLEKIQNIKHLQNKQSEKFKQRRTSISGPFDYQNHKNQLGQQLNLKHYKIDKNKIKQRIKELKSTMLTALNNSFISWYQKFKEILHQLRLELNFIFNLFEKAQNFERSKSKDQIIEFLLITRSKGIQSLIFLEQIYKCILIKLEQSRFQLFYNVSLGFKNRIDQKDQQIQKLIENQQSIKQHINSLFQQSQSMLNIKVERKYVGKNSLLIAEQSQSNQSEKVQVAQEEKQKTKGLQILHKKHYKQSLEQFSKKQKKLLFPKIHKIQKTLKATKKQKNVVLKKPQTFPEDKNQHQQQKKQTPQKVMERQFEGQSSSLEYLIDSKQVAQKVQKSQKSQKENSEPSQKQNDASKSSGNKSSPPKLNFEQLESLSIERDMELKFGQNVQVIESIHSNSISSQQCLMYQKMF